MVHKMYRRQTTKKCREFTRTGGELNIFTRSKAVSHASAQARTIILMCSDVSRFWSKIVRAFARAPNSPVSKTKTRVTVRRGGLSTS